MNDRAVEAIHKAQHARRMGNKAKAAALAKVAFEAALESPAAFALWSVTLRDLGQTALRIDACWRHLDVNPTNQFAWLALSESHETLGNLSRAVDAAQKCAAVAPHWDIALHQLARLQSIAFAGLMSTVAYPVIRGPLGN